MPQAQTIYNGTLKVPSDTVPFQRPSGRIVHYNVWEDTNANKELIKCDLCGQFLPLTVTRLPSWLQRHRDTEQCRAQAQANAAALEAKGNETEQEIVFINTFQEEAFNLRQFATLESGVSTPTNPTTPVATDFTFSNPTPCTSLVSFLNNVIPMTQREQPEKCRTTQGLADETFVSGELDLPRSSPPQSPIPEVGFGDLTLEEDDNSSFSRIQGDACVGQPIDWVAGSVWDTYAYQHHDDDDIGWTPIGYEENGKKIQLKSKDCTLILRSAAELTRKSCRRCYALLNSKALYKFMDRANQDTVPHTPWKFLNFHQLKNMLVISRDKECALVLQAMNYKRKMQRLQAKLNDYQRIVMLVSRHKIAGVSRILAVALRNGASAEAIVTKLSRAIDGTYKPSSGWTAREFDIAFLTKAIGGPRLLYALQKAEGYPSRSTLRTRKPIAEIYVSVGIPNEADFDSNIFALLGEKGRKEPEHRKHGQVVVIDGVAIEEAIRFDFRRRHLLGLCREHSSKVKTLVENYTDIQGVEDAIYGTKSCHHGKDATVLGIAPITADTNYHVTPLVLSSSCKSEKGEELAKWVGKFINAFRKHPDGEQRHGPIYTLATDGESSFRKLRFILCLNETLDKDTDLGRRLSTLPGVNLQTGPHGVLGTCDPKHIVKRFATMIRSPKGIQVGDTHITSGDTLRALQHLPEMSLDKAILLLNPADKQNVPKAVNLIQSLLDLEGQDIHGAGVRPSGSDRVKDIVFISKVLSYFLHPFIKVEMSLSEQLRSLSTYSHLITGLYMQHGLSFMTSALVADSQAIVKNIIFTIARLQLVDRNANYYILFEGTDRLENLFSHVRTQDHARNFDIQQLSQKLSIAAEIDAIFQRHPDLDRGHVRRNLVNARGVDHMNPKCWVGDVCVSGVDITAEYLAGRKQADELLLGHLGFEANFKKLFSMEGHDHLRPNGEYIGSRTVDDDGDEQLEEGLTSAGPGLLCTDQAADDSDEDTCDTIDINQFNGLDVIHKDILNPSAKKSDSHYVEVNGARQYIPTLINNLFGTDRERKALVTTRPLRAQGLTLEKALRKSQDLNSSGDMLDIMEQKVKSGDLGAILTRVRDQICLAVVEVLNFRQGTSTTNLAIVDVDDLDADGTKATTTALQILELVAHEPADNTGGLTWWWPQKYIQILDNQTGPILQQHFVSRVPGKQIRILSPKIIYTPSNHPVWSLSHGDLQGALDLAWTDLNPDSAEILEKIKAIPKISGPGLQKLPYKLLEDGTWKLYIENRDIPIALNLVKLAGGDQRDCHLCVQPIRISDMRNHVGRHILKDHREVEDTSLITGREIGTDPCGWCGKDGCKTHLIMSGDTAKITSNCEYHYQGMQYGPATRASKNKPCTNIPLNCPICPTGLNGQKTTFWKYEFMPHMLARHLNKSNELPFIPVELLVATHISTVEEIMMGIPQMQTDTWRDRYQVPDSDDITYIRSECYEGEDEDEGGEDIYQTHEEFEEEERRARKRGLSMVSTASRDGSPTKKHQP